MRITDQIIRLVRIANKVSSTKATSKEELIRCACQNLSDKNSDITTRTLQRDFEYINELFGIQIAYDRSAGGYIIKERSKTASEYEILLQNFELLSRIDNDSVLMDCVISEHRRPPLGGCFQEILDAIRERRVIEIEYEHYRDNSRVAKHSIRPHFLKESQQRWYLVGYNEEDKLRVYALERISSVELKISKFKPKKTKDILQIFDNSFGIWADENMPVEDIVIRYDKLDSRFVKSMPLHSSQHIIEEDENSLTIGLRLRITNDFVMALLARSRSMEVIAPLSLRQRVERVFREALERNKTDK